MPALSGKKKKKKKEKKKKEKKITSFGQPTSLIAMHTPSAQVALHSRVVAQKALRSRAAREAQKLPLT